MYFSESFEESFCNADNVFQSASRHAFHGDFDIVDGQLKINESYCEAYGLEFKKTAIAWLQSDNNLVNGC